MATGSPEVRPAAVLTGSVLGQAGLFDTGRAWAALDSAVRGEPAPLAGLHA
ncbi:hypothetical protein [Streptomyces sp. SID1121]|uniref:hypothetical protein n=1 Tax=Streptomyces sp. SID1121 TaxID=3425888 RepID=UPI0040572798